MDRQRVVVLGAAGRDFHDFNVAFRDDPRVEVVAFTATQIPGIAPRTYPPELAGPRYPRGIPIRPEAELEALIRERGVHEVVFSYSDASHEHVMHQASRALAAGAGFRLLGPRRTQLRSRRPVVSVGAVRTGCGKSQTSRRLAALLRDLGARVVVMRHPMPYGDLGRHVVQRFASCRDLAAHACTLEEREEYEHYLEEGLVVLSGVDTAVVLRQAEEEAEVIVWDGGNNDLPFLASDLHVVVADPLRLGHERRFHPGEANVRAADVLLINKVDAAAPEAVATLRQELAVLNPRATVVEAASAIEVDDPGAIRGQAVAVVEDGPTLTHGDLSFGAGTVAARRWGARAVVDPRPYASGSLAEALALRPGAAPALPAIGYGPAQLAELERALDAMPVDVVVAGTPVDLGRVLQISKPVVRVRYTLEERGSPTLADVVRERLARVAGGSARLRVREQAGARSAS